MKILLKKVLQIGAAFLSLISGMFWHLSALAQSNSLELQDLPKIDAAVIKAFTLLSMKHNIWAAETAAGAGACLFFLIFFED